MKALLIASDNLYLTPYMSLYVHTLQKHQVEYNILYWDKNHNEPATDDRYVRFEAKNDSVIDKIRGYLCFRATIQKTLKEQKYDLIVCLHSVCNLLLYDVLMTKYKGKYVFDVRDYSFEKYALVRAMENKLVKHSAINIISSEGYKSFLPDGKYQIAHNLPSTDCHPYKQWDNREETPIRICYIGLIRFMEQNKKIIDFFKNDERFQLCFIGTNADQLAPYCKENSVSNVELIGTFDSTKTLEYYRNADLIMNLYGNHTPLLDYALSNKLYYAAMLYKPILVCPDTYMEKVSSHFEFGYVLDMEADEERDKLYAFVTEIEREKLICNCDKFMEYAKNQQAQLLNHLDVMIEQIKSNKDSTQKAKS